MGAPVGEGGGVAVAGAQSCKLTARPTLPRLFSVSWGAAGAAVSALSVWTVVCSKKLAGCLWGASWYLGGDKDEAVSPDCVHEYLYD